MSAMALSHRTYPSFISAMSRSLSEMCAARHDVVQVACGCAAHTVFAVPVDIKVACVLAISEVLTQVSLDQSTL